MHDAVHGKKLSELLPRIRILAIQWSGFDSAPLAEVPYFTQELLCRLDDRPVWMQTIAPVVNYDTEAMRVGEFVVQECPDVAEEEFARSMNVVLAREQKMACDGPLPRSRGGREGAHASNFP